MRGTRAIVGFGLLGLIAVTLGWYFNRQPWFSWCGDKQGCLPPPGRLTAAAIDLGSLLGWIGVGIVGLLAIMLTANGLLRLRRNRRLER